MSKGEEITTHLQTKFGNDTILEIQNIPQFCLTIQAQQLAVVCAELYENPLTYFDFLACIVGLDNGAELNTMEVLYQLYSIPYDIHLRLKVIISRNTPNEALPQVPSVSHIWRTANWHEREVFDLFGIEFKGHPDLRRILLPADWTGFPLRKDDAPPKTYHGIKVEY